MTTEDNTSSANGGTSVKDCQRMIQKSLRLPTVKFLREHLEKAGCPVREDFFKAVNCDQETAGGYLPGEGIIVCSNRVELQDNVNQAIIHELIHAFDECRAANLDWTNCAHHACSEIRAGHLSGDCHYKRELLRGFLKIRGHEQWPRILWKLYGILVIMTHSLSIELLKYRGVVSGIWYEENGDIFIHLGLFKMHKYDSN